MKIKKISADTPPHFKPITISITIDTKEEYDMLVSMVGYNISIPNMFSESKHRQLCFDYMNNFREILVYEN